MSKEQMQKMADEVFHRSALEGQVMAMIDTGYEKVESYITPAGAMLELYQDKKRGKVMALLSWPDTGAWVALHPASVCMNGQLSEAEIARWVVKASGRDPDAAGKTIAVDDVSGN